MYGDVAVCDKEDTVNIGVCNLQRAKRGQWQFDTEYASKARKWSMLCRWRILRSDKPTHGQYPSPKQINAFVSPNDAVSNFLPRLLFGQGPEQEQSVLG